jgi:hypothetical protein
MSVGYDHVCYRLFVLRFLLLGWGINAAQGEYRLRRNLFILLGSVSWFIVIARRSMSAPDSTKMLLTAEEISRLVNVVVGSALVDQRSAPTRCIWGADTSTRGTA